MTERINPYKLFIGAFLPNWLLHRPELSQGSKLCYARLAQYAGDHGYAWPSQTTLAEELCVTPRQIRNYLAELTHHQLIESVCVAFGGTNRYYFRWHRWMGMEETERKETSAQSGSILPLNPEEDCLPIRKDTAAKDNQLRESPEEKKKTFSSEQPDEESVSGSPSVPGQTTTVNSLVRDYNAWLGAMGLPQKLVLSAAFTAKVRSRLREHPEDEFWQTIFERIEDSDFLMGRSSHWRLSLDWLVKNTDNCIKVYEGGYTNGTA